MAETIKIGGELESIATGKVVAAASAIKDKVKNKYQGEINAETDASLADRYTKAETNAQINAKQYEIGAVEIDDVPRENSEHLVRSGAIYKAYSNQVYLSEEGTTEPASFDPQADTLHKGSQLLSDAEKKQARANLGFGDGDIDAAPTAGSNNLVKSGGVMASLNDAVAVGGRFYGDIAELYLLDIPWETCKVQSYLSKLYLFQNNAADSIVAITGVISANSSVIPIRIDRTNDSEHWPINKVLGYVVFRDYADFISKAGTTSSSMYSVNLPVAKNPSYAPLITRTLSEGTINTEVDELQNSVGELSSSVGTLESSVETLEYEVDKIASDKNEVVFKNEGQIEYYENLGTKTGSWRGVGSSTRALPSSVRFNKIIFPPFSSNISPSAKYLIGHRMYVERNINTPLTALTVLAQGNIGSVTADLAKSYTVTLPTPVTVPEGHEVVVLLYDAYQNIYMLGGGSDDTETPPYNELDARVYLVTTTGSETPFELQWFISMQATTAKYKVCNPILKLETESLITEKINKAIEEDVPEIVEPIVEDVLAENSHVDVYLPNQFYAVVGDTLQLFFQAIVGVVNISDYDIYAICDKGKTYPRYFSYTPTVDDIGTNVLTIYVKDRKGIVIGQASCNIVTVAAPASPMSMKSIFTFGDSLTTSGQWPGEAKRRLVGNSTYDSITGNGLSNISFFGYMNTVINEQSVDYFGVGGWTWASYLNKGAGGAFRFYVTGVSQLSLGATYTNNGHTYTIQEINVTGDTGNIRCTTSSNTNTPTTSGTLTKSSGEGDATIAFDSYETENANPLWDDTNNKMSFIPYVYDCGASTIDAVYVLLSWNSQSAWREYSVDDTTGHIANAKTFARTLHTEYPNAKLFIMGIQMPSDTGGLGANYGASGGYVDGYGLKQCALNYNKALQDLCNLDEFSPYCEFVAIAPQFDSHYNMPYYNTNVNIRSTIKEMLGSNGVHPSNPGYFQIADAVYRSIVANFCQSD